jgi:hypothetical protein
VLTVSLFGDMVGEDELRVGWCSWCRWSGDTTRVDLGMVLSSGYWGCRVAGGALAELTAAELCVQVD